MNRSIFDKRRAGLLVPVYALRHEKDFGIGDTIAVKHAIDFCVETGFQVLQLLPILETIGDHSPYSPISSRALSPALLSLTPETVPGLTEEMVSEFAPQTWLESLRVGKVSQGSVQPLKMHLLLAACSHSRCTSCSRHPSVSSMTRIPIFWGSSRPSKQNKNTGWKPTRSIAC